MKWTDVKFSDELFLQTDISVSKSYSESAILKLTKMVLNINENNTVDFDINSGICIEYNDLVKLKDLARDIIGDYDDNKE